MVDPARSGLPPFLAKNSGLESGMMIVHYVAAAALSEMHAGAMPMPFSILNSYIRWSRRPCVDGSNGLLEFS